MSTPPPPPPGDAPLPGQPGAPAAPSGAPSMSAPTAAGGGASKKIIVILAAVIGVGAIGAGGYFGYNKWIAGGSDENATDGEGQGIAMADDWSTAESSVKTVFNGLADSRPEIIWEAMPAGHKAALNGEVKKAIGNVDAEIVNKVREVVQKASAIAIAPVDSAGIAPAVEDAMNAGIPIIAVDTGVTGADVTSFVATDNLAVAKVQGAVAATLVANGDTIIYVTGNQAQTTGQERRDGFLSAFASARPDSKVLIVPTEWNSAQAQSGVEAVLNANSDVKMVANAWDGGTMGAKAALENLGYKAGQVKLVGFDGAGDAIEAMEAGWVHADTAQMLYQMGYQGVKAAVAAVQGKAVKSRIDTGFFLVTPSTVQAYKDMVGM